jgi:hypothetical protein
MPSPNNKGVLPSRDIGRKARFLERDILIDLEAGLTNFLDHHPRDCCRLLSKMEPNSVSSIIRALRKLSFDGSRQAMNVLTLWEYTPNVSFHPAMVEMGYLSRTPSSMSSPTSSQPAATQICA